LLINLIITIVSLIIGSIGIVLTVYFQQKAEKIKKASRRLEWSDIQAAANEIGNKLRTSGFLPSIIITPSLSGATFANLLADYFDGQAIVFVGMRYPKNNNKSTDSDRSAPFKRDTINLNSMVHFDLRNWDVYIPKQAFICANKVSDGILIVDDYCNSGQCIKQIVNKLIKKSCIQLDRIKSATIGASPYAQDRVDVLNYWWIIIPTHEKFYFPWGIAQ